MNLKLLQKLFILFVFSVLIIFSFTALNYPGHVFIYIIFTIAFNIFFISGFTKGRIFFDTFLGIFFWLGFWLKFSVRVAFMGEEFQAAEQIGEFIGSGADFDHALLVSSIAIIALLVVSFIRRKWFFSYEKVARRSGLPETYAFYKKNRRAVLVSFAVLFTLAAVINVVFGIYQRGSVPRTMLPFKLDGIFTWLLLFGLASISTVILDCEFKIRDNPYLVTLLSFFESFFSNVSMLSRGMILNGSAILVGLVENGKRRAIDMKTSYKLIILIVFLSFFVSSVFAVNHLRKGLFYQDFPVDSNISKSFVAKHLQDSIGKLLKTPPKAPVMGKGVFVGYVYQIEFIIFKIKLFIFNKLQTMSHLLIEALMNLEALLLDRWVGIEGVMAVSSYSHLGWDLWKAGWQERYSHSGTSMYDVKILKSPFANMTQHHFISLPGIVAFFYYPGSYLFLFIAMLIVGSLGAAIEIFVYKLSGGNFILCSLIAQVVAYRYASFGYVPRQSYLLFGSICLNILIIYLMERILYRLNQSKDNSVEPESLKPQY